MKIQFSAPGAKLNELRDRIFEAVEKTAPGAFVELDPAHSMIVIELAPDADADATAEALRLRFLELGLSVSRVAPTAPPPFGGQAQFYQTPPPIRFDAQKPRTVRLSVFVISLIAVALAVAVLSFSFSGLLRASSA